MTTDERDSPEHIASSAAHPSALLTRSWNLLVRLLHSTGNMYWDVVWWKKEKEKKLEHTGNIFNQEKKIPAQTDTAKSKPQEFCFQIPTDEVWIFRNFFCLPFSTLSLFLHDEPGPGSRSYHCFLFISRQPPNDVEMALGGTLLPSISTFASGPAVKSKAIGVANSVSSMRSLSHEILCERGAAHWDIFVSATVSLCCAEIGLDTTLCWGVHHFTQADPVSSQSPGEAHMGQYRPNTPDCLHLQSPCSFFIYIYTARLFATNWQQQFDGRVRFDHFSVWLIVSGHLFYVMLFCELSNSGPLTCCGHLLQQTLLSNWLWLKGPKSLDLHQSVVGFLHSVSIAHSGSPSSFKQCLFLGEQSSLDPDVFPLATVGFSQTVNCIHFREKLDRVSVTFL